MEYKSSSGLANLQATEPAFLFTHSLSKSPLGILHFVMSPQPSGPSSSTRPPLRCAHTSCDHGEGCSPWHYDLSAGDELFTKENQEHDDLIIVVTGLTGAGKSTFINQCLGKGVMKVGHGMRSCTEKVKSVVAMLPESHPTRPNCRLVLVDTPGFDDTTRSDLDILRSVATWLASTYDSDTKITGLVHLFNIGNPRMGGEALLSRDIFHELCGPNALRRVVMATTHWGETKRTRQVCQNRLEELKRDFWAGFLASGAIHMVVPGPDHEGEELENNVNDIVEYILQKQMAVATEVQQELVDSKKRVKDTKAGQKLTDALNKRLGEPETPRPASPEDVRPDDLIIVIMGSTRSGKSTFINRFCGKDVRQVYHGLKSCTKEIGATTYTLPSTHPSWPGRRVVLVDTPSFDHTDEGEFEILRRISMWLADVYRRGVKITGLIYLHSIDHNRISGSSLLSHDIFRSICGPGALNNVVIATTQWDTIPTRNKSAGPSREKDIKEFWRDTLEQGAAYMRVEVPEDDPRRDTQRIIDHILQKDAVTLRIQEELVDLNMRVEETEAAQALSEMMQRWFGDSQTQEASEETEEEQRKFPVERGLVDRVKRLFQLKSHPDLARGQLEGGD
ncbi:hypothetical protein MD484_g5092, partial [Candolleomyces efflorescens]